MELQQDGQREDEKYLFARYSSLIVWNCHLFLENSTIYYDIIGIVQEESLYRGFPVLSENHFTHPEYGNMQFFPQGV